MRWTMIDSRAVALAAVLEAGTEPERLPGGGAAADANLTARETEIVSHVAMGQRAHEIADELGITESTVRTHLRNALRKTGARSQAQLVAMVCCGQASAPGIAI